MSKKLNRAKIAARELLKKYGIKDVINDFPLEKLVFGLGATLIYKKLSNSDGRIIFGKKNTLIEIDIDITSEQKRRSVIAHELGHFILHKGIDIHNDNDNTLSWFNDKEKQAKEGILEQEANQFAAELLIPSNLFYEEQKGKKFSPDLLRELALKFKASITSIAFKYFEVGDHDICLFHCYNNLVKYWRWPKGYPHFIIDRTKLAPPSDSVAAEFFNNGVIHKKEHSAQQVWKSTWFELRSYDEDNDFNFFEYCIVLQQANIVLSVVWEE